MMFNSLRSWLMASYIVVIVVILAAAGLTLALGLRIAQDRVTEVRLRTSVPLATRLVRELTLQGLESAEIVEELQESVIGSKARVLLIQRGVVVGDTTAGELVGQQVLPPAVPRRLREAPRAPITGRFITPAGAEYIYAMSLAAPAQSPPRANPQKPPDHLLVAQVVPRRPLGSLEEMGRPLLWSALIVVCRAMVMAWVHSRSVSRPLREITTATERIAEGDLDVKLDVQGPTEVMQLADRFERMAVEVSASRQAQRDFIANVSHDLKTPLTSIQGFSQALLEGVVDDPERTKRSAQIIHDESLRMGRLVEQLIDLARWDSGQIELVYAPIDISELIALAVERVRISAEHKGVTLGYSCEHAVWISGDADRLMQVLINLLDNAIRYTPTGGQVACSMRRSTKDRNRVEIRVSDNGAGITPEDLPHVFDRFYQVDKARGRENDGLGLTIVREIVQAHGGEVGVESTVGVGTQFWVRLPLG